MELVSEWISRYGYAGIFMALALGIVGLPMPDETLLTFAGYLVHRGDLRLMPTLISALLGSICGITVSYSLGRLTGYVLIEKYGARLHISMDHIHHVQNRFRRLGGFALVFGYFIPGVRHLTGYVAGASELDAPTFGAFAYLGALLWSHTFIFLGYFLGEEWHRVSGLSHWLLIVAAATAGIAALGYWMWRRRRAS
jgi:membrane protein DedA with SNARE-associated domain